MGTMTYRPMRATLGPDFFEGKESGSGREEDGPDEGEEKSYLWIQIVQGCDVQSGCNGKE